MSTYSPFQPPVVAPTIEPVYMKNTQKWIRTGRPRKTIADTYSNKLNIVKSKDIKDHLNITAKNQRYIYDVIKSLKTQWSFLAVCNWKKTYWFVNTVKAMMYMEWILRNNIIKITKNRRAMYTEEEKKRIDNWKKKNL